MLPSEKVPAAVNCCVAFRAMIGDWGEIAIDMRATGVTARLADPLMVPTTAEIDADPTATDVASP